MVAQATHSVLSKRASRSGEARTCKGHCSRFSNFRLGEGSSPGRGSSAWARSWARMRFSLVFFLSFDGWSVFYCTIIWWHGGNEYAWGGRCMGYEQWVLSNALWWTWDGWYQNGTVSVWGEMLYLWLRMDELEWYSTWNVNEEFGYEEWHESHVHEND